MSMLCHRAVARISVLSPPICFAALMLLTYAGRARAAEHVVMLM